MCAMLACLLAACYACMRYVLVSECMRSRRCANDASMRRLYMHMCAMLACLLAHICHACSTQQPLAHICYACSMSLLAHICYACSTQQPHTDVYLSLGMHATRSTQQPHTITYMHATYMARSSLILMCISSGLILASASCCCIYSRLMLASFAHRNA